MGRRRMMPTAAEFTEALADNEECMADMAAFAATCEQLGISEEDAYDLLAEEAGL